MSTPSAKKPVQLTIAVIGEGAVGKSSITLQYIKNSWDSSESHEPTIEDTFEKKENIDGQIVNLCIVDTAGQDEYASIVENAIRAADGYVIVYDITNYDSFSRLKNRIATIFRTRCEDFELFLDDDEIPNKYAFLPMAIIGNKVDMENKRKVPTDDAKRFAQSLISLRVEGSKGLSAASTTSSTPRSPTGKGVPFFEGSAKTRNNIENAFHACIRQTINFQKLMATKKKKGGRKKTMANNNNNNNNKSTLTNKKKPSVLTMKSLSMDEENDMVT